MRAWAILDRGRQALAVIGRESRIKYGMVVNVEFWRSIVEMV
jgi:hypothetical protein